MTGRGPRVLAAELEKTRSLPPGEWERFAGYGVVGLPFTLGHVLAFQRLTASSIGPPHTTVWHRDPAGIWTVYTDVEPSRSCPRYFGAALDEVIATNIRLEWTGGDRLSIAVPEYHLEWAVRLDSTRRTRLLNGLSTVTARMVLHHPGGLGRFGAVIGWATDAGPLQLAGRTPNGQTFAVLPWRVWTVSASAAVVRGRDLGPLGPHPENPRVGELVLPNRGILAAQHAWFEPFDPADHLPVSTVKSRAS
jgi:hypothetical protein